MLATHAGCEIVFGACAGTNGEFAEPTVIYLWGEHDAATERLIGEVLRDGVDLSTADIIVDLSAVTFFSACSVGALAEARNRLLRESRSLQVRKPPRGALRVLDLCGLGEIVIDLESPAAVPGAGSPACRW